jgi:hypothetical protein
MPKLLPLTWALQACLAGAVSASTEEREASRPAADEKDARLLPIQVRQDDLGEQHTTLQIHGDLLDDALDRGIEKRLGIGHAGRVNEADEIEPAAVVLKPAFKLDTIIASRKITGEMGEPRRQLRRHYGASTSDAENLVVTPQEAGDESEADAAGPAGDDYRSRHGSRALPLERRK